MLEYIEQEIVESTPRPDREPAENHRLPSWIAGDQHARCDHADERKEKALEFEDSRALDVAEL